MADSSPQRSALVWFRDDLRLSGHPALVGLPNDATHAPFAAAPMILAAAGVRLGETYPPPLLEHRAARERALSAFAALKAAPS
jgi:deoxyribodipyrimidine photolyase